MTRTANLIAWTSVALLAITLAGLVVRGTWRTWYTFTAYVAIMAAFATGVRLWPHVYYVPEAWVVQQNVVNALRFAMALELALRTFSPFPGARSSLRLVLLAVLTATFAMVMLAAGGGGDYRRFLQELQPRLLNGSVLVFTAIAGLILWYRLPVAALHKSILLAYVPYLLFQLVYLHVLVALGWERKWLGYVYQVAYVVLVALWAWSAWRSGRPPDRAPSPDEGPAA
jgi:hypothetical protein